MRALDLLGGGEILSYAECVELLADEEVGRLAVVGDDGLPDIFPVNYVLEDGDVLVATNPGDKARALDRGPVALEVDVIDRAAHHGWSVVVHGLATAAPAAPPAATHAATPATAPTAPGPAEATGRGPRRQEDPWAGPKSLHYRIRILSLSGRRV